MYGFSLLKITCLYRKVQKEKLYDYCIKNSSVILPNIKIPYTSTSKKKTFQCKKKVISQLQIVGFWKLQDIYEHFGI